MFDFKNYKFGFDWRGLIMFLSFLTPFLIWLVLPHMKPIEMQSKTPINDIFEIIFNVLVVLSLTFIINKESKKKSKKIYFIGIIIPKIIYFTCWIIAYFGIYNHFITMTICIIPALTFFFFAWSRKNLPAMVFSIGFLVCSTIFTVLNVLQY